MQVWVALLSCIPWARKHEKTFSTVLLLFSSVRDNSVLFYFWEGEFMEGREL